MHSACLVVAIALLQTATSQILPVQEKCTPTLSIAPVQINTVDGTAELTCSVQCEHNHSLYDIMWIKFSNENRLHYEILFDLEDLENKFSFIDSRTKNNNFALKINNLQKEDAGIYECSIRNTYNVIRKTAKLQIGNSSAADQSISTNLLREVFQDEGESVTFNCYNHSPDNFTVWVKEERGTFNMKYGKLPSGAELIGQNHENTEEVLFRTFKTLNNKTKYSESYDAESRSRIIQIHDLQESDSTLYECLVGAPLVNVYKVKLEVRTSPRIKYLGPKLVESQLYKYDRNVHSLLVSEGQSVLLECNAIGNPLPTIFWRRESNANLSTGGLIYRGKTLEIFAIQKEHRGKYLCYAENGVRNSSKTKFIDVEVEFAPIVTNVSLIFQKLLNLTVLKCYVEGYPRPKTYWFKDGVRWPITLEEAFSYSESTGIYTTVETLQVTNHQLQNGRYTCRAYNKLGNAEGFNFYSETPAVKSTAYDQPTTPAYTKMLDSVTFVTEEYEDEEYESTRKNINLSSED